MSGYFAELTAQGASGKQEQVKVSVSGEFPHELTLLRTGKPPEKFHGDNLFSCLLSLREHLEMDGLLLCCQGARLDVTNSGMQKQMTGGRYVYTFDPVERTVHQQTVDILDPAPYCLVGTVAEHRAAIFSLFGLNNRSD